MTPLHDAIQVLWPALGAWVEILLLARRRTVRFAALPTLVLFAAPMVFLIAITLEITLARNHLPFLLGLSGWIEPLIVAVFVWLALLVAGPHRTLADGAAVGASIALGPWLLFGLLRVGELHAELHAFAWQALPSPAWALWVIGISIPGPSFGPRPSIWIGPVATGAALGIALQIARRYRTHAWILPATYAVAATGQTSFSVAVGGLTITPLIPLPVLPPLGPAAARIAALDGHGWTTTVLLGCLVIGALFSEGYGQSARLTKLPFLLTRVRPLHSSPTAHQEVRLVYCRQCGQKIDAGAPACPSGHPAARTTPSLEERLPPPAPTR